MTHDSTTATVTTLAPESAGCPGCTCVPTSCAAPISRALEEAKRFARREARREQSEWLAEFLRTHGVEYDRRGVEIRTLRERAERAEAVLARLKTLVFVCLGLLISAGALALLARECSRAADDPTIERTRPVSYDHTAARSWRIVRRGGDLVVRITPHIGHEDHVTYVVLDRLGGEMPDHASRRLYSAPHLALLAALEKCPDVVEVFPDGELSRAEIREVVARHAQAPVTLLEVVGELRDTRGHRLRVQRSHTQSDDPHVLLALDDPPAGSSIDGVAHLSPDQAFDVAMALLRFVRSAT